METLLRTTGGLALFAAMLLGSVILNTVVGAFIGWAVGLVLGDTILLVASKAGLSGLAMWQIGAFLGFVGGFLITRPLPTTKE